MMTFQSAFEQMPLVAILRGILPDEVEAVGEVLVEAGFRLIEIPLNSPEPLTSIERLARCVGHSAVVGAGTVLTVDQVDQVGNAGGRLIVSPNTNPEVIAATVQKSMVSLPGFYTPSEAFAALAAGADALKLFPAEAATPAVMKAYRAVLPAAVPILAVGGITPDNLQPWREAGADGFGLGSALYRNGLSVRQIGENARAFVAAWNEDR
ncbi:2-dehydro-3-deoxy-6-phosphogalactonate aldolase [Novosphingobium naphthalenivorans]|uniref:2-dehydro-3-deoxy-6-phosphogalactonate aldolase n=1 Tax=Novosphingobium naphthalenivorans TaxID=273168 RepID=UPI000A52305B|nr:2-dehydro-3-deoxy-6-phosphogalactonate aldolase [Novosphingobium naphthalenivorans]